MAFKQVDITAEVKTAMALKADGTWNDDDLLARLIQIVGEASTSGDYHKEIVERLIKDGRLMREAQQNYFRHKKGQGVAIGLEQHFDKKLNHLLSIGYSIDRFKNEAKQRDIFGG